ncbi:MAG TPA: 7-cyano-7-deazaguanine synthase QueC [Methylocystis sp.]|nr:7-cyano-7-deazaguanine synthase QueC [Methylocystis sp.]
MNASSPVASALVLFSGGQDSTVCLAHALSQRERVETIGFDYGQRHRVELAQRERIRAGLAALSPAWRERLGDDHLIAIPALGEISQTALTRETEIAFEASGLPNTFVPGRNILFLTLAAALAYRRGISLLIGGMCETDYSGYPDCRRATIDATERALSLGLDRDIVIETPLMRLDKAATWRMTEALGGHALVRLVVEETHSCYLGERKRRFEWGYGCGDCPACRLRAAGYEKYVEGAVGDRR